MHPTDQMSTAEAEQTIITVMVNVNEGKLKKKKTLMQDSSWPVML